MVSADTWARQSGPGGAAGRPRPGAPRALQAVGGVPADAVGARGGRHRPARGARRPPIHPCAPLEQKRTRPGREGAPRGAAVRLCTRSPQSTAGGGERGGGEGERVGGREGAERDGRGGPGARGGRRCGRRRRPERSSGDVSRISRGAGRPPVTGGPGRRSLVGVFGYPPGKRARPLGAVPTPAPGISPRASPPRAAPGPPPGARAAPRFPQRFPPASLPRERSEAPGGRRDAG